MGKENAANVPIRILNSAYKCISQKGYAKASLRDIAEDAGVALSQLSYYYKNREGLFHEVINKLSRDYIGEIEQMLQKSGTAIDKLNDFIEYFKGMMGSRPELFRVLFDFFSLSMWNASFKTLLSSLSDEMSNLIKENIFEEPAVQNRFKNVSADALARTMLETMFGAAMQYILNPLDHAMIESLDSSVCLLTDLMLLGQRPAANAV